MPALICPVRPCRQTLARTERRFVCPAGHSFDLARSGYLNLLQPQDRRSLAAGDSKPVAQARRHLFEAGCGDFLIEVIQSGLGRLGLPARPAVLDVGCGEGSVLAALAREREIEAHGVDLSVPALELAARLLPAATWVVANADRFLPWADGSFDLVMSLTARLHVPELRRVLAPGGLLLVAVAGEDDLVELRQAVLGEGALKDRGERALASFSGAFELSRRETVQTRLDLDLPALLDLLATTYRGARHRERERAAGLGAMAVTLSRELLWLRGC